MFRGATVSAKTDESNFIIEPDEKSYSNSNQIVELIDFTSGVSSDKTVAKFKLLTISNQDIVYYDINTTILPNIEYDITILPLYIDRYDNDQLSILTYVLIDEQDVISNIITYTIQ